MLLTQISVLLIFQLVFVFLFFYYNLSRFVKLHVQKKCLGTPMFPSRYSHELRPSIILKTKNRKKFKVNCSLLSTWNFHNWDNSVKYYREDISSHTVWILRVVNIYLEQYQVVRFPREVKYVHWLVHFIIVQIGYSQELPIMFYKFIEHSNINITLYKTWRNIRKTDKI